MSHADELRSYLETVRGGHLRWIEVAAPLLRHHERTVLRLLEAAGAAHPDAHSQTALRHLHEQWIPDEYLEDLVAALYTTVAELFSPASEAAATTFVDHALAFLLDDENLLSIEIPASPWSHVRTRALERAAEAARLAQLGYEARGLTRPQRYAQQLGLVHQADETAGCVRLPRKGTAA